jgi:hypothetical protein
MAQQLDDEIPVPLGSGATDQPDVVQHGMSASGKAVAGPKATPATQDEGVDLSAHSSFAPSKTAAVPKAAKIPTGDSEGIDLDQHSKFSSVKVTQPQQAKPIAQPSTWQVLTQPTEQTDKDYMGYTGPAGYAGATIHGMSNVARDTTGALKSMYHMVVDPATAEEQARDKAQGSESTSPLGRAGMVAERAIRGMVVDPAKQLYQNSTKAGLAEQNAAIKDINASPDPMAHYAQAAEDTASQGAGQALTAIGMEAAHKVPGEVKASLPEVKAAAGAPVRLASRAAGHVLPAAPIVGEMAGGFPGRMAAHSLRGGIADIVEHGKTVGLPELEKKAVTLEGRAADATKAQVKAQAQADLYTASHVPESVDKALTKANEAATDAKMHAEAAREAANADKAARKAARKAPAGPPAAQVTAKQPTPAPAPDFQNDIDQMAPRPAMAKLGPEPAPPAPPMRAMNVKGPGEVQPETFPRQATAAPMVRPGQTEIPGGRMGRTMQLPEAPMNLPQEVLPPEIAPERAATPAPAKPKTPTTIEMGPGKLATPEPEAKAAPTTPSVKPEDLKTQIERGLGNKPVEPGVPMKEQGKVAETEKEPVKVSSDPRKATLQKAGASDEEIAKILQRGSKFDPTSKVGMSKLAEHFGVDLGDKAIGRGKGDTAAGTHIAPHEVLERILKDHSPAEIAKAIDDGKHLPTVSGASQGYEGPERRGLKTPEVAYTGSERRNPFRDTEGAKETIARDENMPKHPAEEVKAKAKEYATPEKGVPEHVLAKGPEAEAARAATVASDKLAKSWESEEKTKAEAKEKPEASKHTYMYERMGEGHQVTAKDADGKTSGIVTALPEEGSPNTWTVRFSQAAKAGTGVGEKSYARLLEAARAEADRTGKPITVQGDTQMSDSAQRTWTKMEHNRGYDVKWTNGRPSVKFEPNEEEEVGPDVSEEAKDFTKFQTKTK